MNPPYGQTEGSGELPGAGIRSSNIASGAEAATPQDLSERPLSVTVPKPVTLLFLLWSAWQHFGQATRMAPGVALVETFGQSLGDENTAKEAGNTSIINKLSA